jgi:PBP1b-binding outer membrane lipoprotein LpoB
MKKLVVAILLILAAVLVGCNGSTAVVASPTVEVLPTEKPTATQIPPTATQEPTSTPI